MPTVVTLGCILVFYLNPFDFSGIIAPEINRELYIREMTRKPEDIIPFKRPGMTLAADFGI